MKRYLLIILALFLVVSPALAQEPESYKLYLPFVTKCSIPGFEPMSDWRVIVPEATTNYCLNPSAETTGNYTAEAGTTVDRSTTYQKYGLYSYRVQTDADNEGVELTLSALTNAIHTVTMRVRGTLPSAWDWSLNDANWHTPTLEEAIDSNWSLYSAEIPAAQANGSTKLSIHQNGAGSGDFYIDGIQVEPTEDYYTTYCDGTQDGCAWNGAEHASTSTRSAVSRAGGRLYDLQEDYSLDIGGVTGAGAAQVRLSDDPYAMLPGGQLNSAKIQSRVFSLSGVIRGTSTADLNAKRQALVELFAHDAYPQDADGWQPVRLRYAGAATQKQISAHYEGGLELDIRATDVCWWERVTVRFFAPDPFWYEVGESAELLDNIDSVQFRYIAGRLKSTGQWDDLGLTNDPTVNGTIYAITYNPVDGLYYVGGDFEEFDGDADIDYIVSYDPSSDAWAVVGAANAVNGIVRAIAIAPNGDVYIGGDFTDVGGADGDYVAYYDLSGGSWSPVAAGGAGAVYALLFGLDGTLYIGGNFTDWGDANGDYVVSWTGAAYVSLSTGLTSAVNALEKGTDGTIYAGTEGGSYLYTWDGSSWTAFTSTVNGAVNALAWGTDNGHLYIGGEFTTAGGVTANYLVAWDGSGYIIFSGSMDDDVNALAVAPDGMLYAAGSCTVAGTLDLLQPTARWNKSSWTHLDADFPLAATTYAVACGPPDAVVSRNYSVLCGMGWSALAYFSGLTDVINDGTVSAFPSIHIKREGGAGAKVIMVRNETTGKELDFDYDLLDGETLTIELKPFEKSVTSSFFGQQLGAMLAGSDSGDFILQPGSNDISCFVNETEAPTITAWAEWRDAYRSLD